MLKHQTAAVAALAAIPPGRRPGGLAGSVAYQRKAAEVAREQAVAESQGDLINAMADLSRGDVVSSRPPAMDPRLVNRALRAIEDLRRDEQAAGPEVRENWAITAMKVAKEAEARGLGDGTPSGPTASRATSMPTWSGISRATPGPARTSPRVT